MLRINNQWNYIPASNFQFGEVIETIIKLK